MRKYSRREKRVLKLLAVVCLIALVLEIDARFRQAKANLVLEIENQQGLLDTYLEKLQSDTNAEGYHTKTVAIETELEQFRDRVLELPRESDATLLIKETIDDLAKEMGMNISSISSRKSKALVDDQPILELKTYFAFDTNLESMLEFFQAVSNQGYFMVIDTISLSPRRRISRRGRRNRSKAVERPPLNGNAVLKTLFLPNEKGSFDPYLNRTQPTRNKPAGETPGGESTTPPPEKATPMKKPVAQAKPPKKRDTQTLEEVPPTSKPAKPFQNKFTDLDSQREVDREKNRKKALQQLGLKPPPRPLTSTARPKKEKTRF